MIERLSWVIYKCFQDLKSCLRYATNPLAQVFESPPCDFNVPHTKDRPSAKANKDMVEPSMIDEILNAMRNLVVFW